MKKIKMIICSIIVMLGVLAPLSVTGNAMAATVDGKPTYFEWNCAAGQDGITCIVMSVYNWLSVGVLIIVVIGIILGGIQYGTAQGDQSQAKTGLEKIRNAFIALFLYFAMWAFLNFVVPGGLFDSTTGEPKASINNPKDSHYAIKN